VNKLTLNVQAIFNSIDGEVNGFHGAGELCTFIRLRGCNLRCSYCDTKYAQDGEITGTQMTVKQIMDFPGLLSKVTITGGEPLLQRNMMLKLVEKLISKGHRITIETNGTQIPLPPSNLNLRYVMDYKLPSSEVCDQMIPQAFEALMPVDVIKFVIADYNDFYYARDLVIKNKWLARIVFSPMISNNKLYNTWVAELAELMLHDSKLFENVQYSLQLHKILWPNVKEER